MKKSFGIVCAKSIELPIEQFQPWCEVNRSVHSLSISMESAVGVCIEMQILLFAMSQLIATFSFYF